MNGTILKPDDILFEEPTQFLGRQMEVDYKGKKQVLTISNIILNDDGHIPSSVTEEGHNRRVRAEIEFQDSNIVAEVVSISTSDIAYENDKVE